MTPFAIGSAGDDFDPRRRQSHTPGSVRRCADCGAARWSTDLPCSACLPAAPSGPDVDAPAPPNSFPTRRRMRENSAGARDHLNRTDPNPGGSI